MARSLSARGLETVLIEASSAIGGGISSRNSEVVHAGLYYSPGSLRGKLCREGNTRMYEFCTEMKVPHSRCGKLVRKGLITTLCHSQNLTVAKTKNRLLLPIKARRRYE